MLFLYANNIFRQFPSRLFQTSNKKEHRHQTWKSRKQRKQNANKAQIAPHKPAFRTNFHSFSLNNFNGKITRFTPNRAQNGHICRSFQQKSRKAAKESTNAKTRSYPSTSFEKHVNDLITPLVVCYFKSLQKQQPVNNLILKNWQYYTHNSIY